MKRILSIVLTLALLLTAIPLALSVSAAETAVATFEFGANGSASHVDGNDLGTSKTYTDGDYSLKLTSMNKVYGPAYDAKGNSCIKLGTSSTTGSFAFTVPADITKVEILVAKYKANTTKVTCNNASTTLTKNSNDGAYDVISVNTVATKTVSFSTASGGVRAMVNTIIFYKEVAGACAHTNTTLQEGDLSSHYYVCDDCEEVASTEPHDYEIIGTTDSSCTEWGSTIYECTICGKDKTDAIVKKLHNYENGACTMCKITNPVFDFGANGAAEHKDGSAVTTYTEEVNGFTLKLTGLTKVYNKAYDVYGNSCIKLGTDSETAAFTFTVPNNVDEVIIAAAKYKSKASKLDINGTQTTLTKNSDNGEYDLITIDTTETKTITVKTIASYCRAMINSITFVVGETTECTHAKTDDAIIEEPTYFKAGSKNVVCADCKEIVNKGVALDRVTANAITFTPSYEGSKLTIKWVYSDELSIDIDKANDVKLNIGCTIGDEVVKNLPDFAATNDSGEIEIDGFNVARLDKIVALDLTFDFGGAYDTDLVAELNNTAKYTVVAKNVADESDDSTELNTLIDAIGEQESIVVNGNNTSCDNFDVAYSKVDIANATAEFKFTATDAFITAVKANSNYNDGRTVNLVVNIGGKDYTVKIDFLKTNITVKISGLSFSQMYGDITAKLVITYAADSVGAIKTDNITVSFDDAIAASEDSAAVALEALMTK